MYPKRELIRLAVHKAALRRDIALRRHQCVQAAAGVAQPLVWLDRVVAIWRQLSPLTLLAAVPLGWIFKRTVSPRLKFLGALARWGPLVVSAVRGINSAVRTRFRPAGSPRANSR